eukprot:CAMPEP_0176196500 /NCGR_PEP_ID=MMETSP0121_2-20121125/7060_1 /TAXON_ID=160619 /ORGANISM="Kryptoperidinium foliaceum, Strain CCMP 1326" /LENGTH=172 /DNA_ID=CAMNT_0017535303 /DNA_START=87 /DNA_END=603 /DNA_ORIENTATION=-
MQLGTAPCRAEVKQPLGEWHHQSAEVVELPPQHIRAPVRWRRRAGQRGHLYAAREARALPPCLRLNHVSRARGQADEDLRRSDSALPERVSARLRLPPVAHEHVGPPGAPTGPGLEPLSAQQWNKDAPERSAAPARASRKKSCVLNALSLHQINRRRVVPEAFVERTAVAIA